MVSLVKPRGRDTRAPSSTWLDFNYPSLPPTSLDTLTNRPFDAFPSLNDLALRSRRIERSDSRNDSCLNLGIASLSLDSDTESQRRNECLLRSHHPALKDAREVYVWKEVSGNEIWTVKSDPGVMSSALPIVPRVGGKEVHIIPPTYEFDWNRSAGRIDDPFGRAIWPRRLLTKSDIGLIRAIFPSCCGARVFISGLLVILFKNWGELNDAELGQYPEKIGDMEWGVDVLKLEPLPVGSGDSASDGTIQPSAIGVSIVCDDEEVYLTAMTHALAKCHGESKRKDRLISRVKSLVKMRATSSSLSSSSTSTTIVPTPAKNEPVLVGKKLGFKGKEDAATIAKTYDYPVTLQPFPYGYYHDLSLVSCCSSPLSTVSRAAVPIDGFTSDYDQIMDGRLAVYVSRYKLTSADSDTLPSGVGDYPAHVITKPAIVEGCEYLWLPPVASTMKVRATVSFMWRAEENAEVLNDWTSRAMVVDSSYDSGGAELGKVVVMQNYTICLAQPSGKDGQRRVKGNVSSSEGRWPVREEVKYLNGGFLLPDDIRACKIEVDGGMGRQTNAYARDTGLEPLIEF
ncbi:hypothetical protein AAP_01040 [Ascosphaera apis ARSEF 7405]|uniref:Uncharacterized protein n=1 Tax=Ascosphaera apis ARSEF 7405 TaxID=392613 RepID=A0A168C831_9EURO|nr:hypothetical protein AAP_01040 [Ascosphaera apis ARSEF 7405]